MRRREIVRRHLAEAAEEFEWDVVAALEDEPLQTIRDDVRRMLKTGVRALRKRTDEELELRKERAARLKRLVKDLRKRAEDPDSFPFEVTYEYPARPHGTEFPVKEETLTLETPKDALKAAADIEKSMPRWEKIRKEAVVDLKRRQQTIDELAGDLQAVVRGWQPLMRDIVHTMA